MSEVAVTKIRVATCEIRPAFARWLGAEGAKGAHLVVLEGLTGSGKTKLTELPFVLETSRSVNIELDTFLRRPVPETTLYVDAIDRAAFDAAATAAFASSRIVIIEGPIAWPFAQPMAATLRKEEVRRVYLKRMWRLNPDFWQDEDYLNDRKLWPPTDYHRSIYRYHAEQRPWLEADLVLERIEDD